MSWDLIDSEFGTSLDKKFSKIDGENKHLKNDIEALRNKYKNLYENFSEYTLQTNSKINELEQSNHFLKNEILKYQQDLVKTQNGLLEKMLSWVKPKKKETNIKTSSVDIRNKK